MKTRRLSAKNQIEGFIHCATCLREWKAGLGGHVTPAQYARINVGFTAQGLQVWCVRHDLNIVHIDFQGQTHPANMEAKDEEPS